MKDKCSITNPGWGNNVPPCHTPNVKELQNEIDRLKTLVSKISQSMTWGNSVLKVVFRDEFYDNKYRSKIEKFLKEILDTGEDFILISQVYDNAEQEYRKNQNSFQSENIKTQQSSVPIYSNKFTDVLHCDEPEIEEQIDPNKPSSMTCFNCLGDHHMNKCPEKKNPLRIAANKKDILNESSRYHEDEIIRSLKPGVISCELRQALNLKPDQLPKHIYNMRIIGYPPGWMDDAVFETSGLSLYDSPGKSTELDDDSLETCKQYDEKKLVEFPGFNMPVTSEFKDEHMELGMPPIKPEQQLTETIKSINITKNLAANKRKFSVQEDDEPKKICKGTNDSLKDPSPENCSPPKKTESLPLNIQNNTPASQKLGISLSSSPGTPILKQGNPFERLPDADKFASGITEHIPFENLPEYVGTFDKMRGILSDVQLKLKNIKKDS